MDSYRPGQPPDERDAGGDRGDGVPRDDTRARDFERSDEHPRDYDRYRPERARGSRHDMHCQQQSRGDYWDLDRSRGGRRYYKHEDMYYDEEGVRSGERDPNDPQTSASVNNYSYSDMLRFDAQRAGPPNTGKKDKDSNDTPNRFLLIRGLKLSLTEDLLAKGLEKLYRGADDLEGGATPLSLLSVMIVRMRDSKMSAGYGFAEFHTVKDAKAAREKSKALGQWCTVASQEFQADFPHAGVFPAASLPGSHGPTPAKYTFTMSQTGRSHKYNDERYFVQPVKVNEHPAEDVIDRKEANTGRGHDVQTGSKRGITDVLENQQSKPKKAKKAAGPTKLAQLEHWQSKKEELDKMEEPSGTISEPLVSSEQSFAVLDESGGRCYLCNTAFKTSDNLMRHLSDSETHTAFSKQESRREKARQRLEKKQVDLASTVKIPASQPAAADTAAPAPDPRWRDRAAERRQGAKIGFSLKSTASAAQKSRPGSSGSEGAKPALDKGRGMLAKLGWSEGEGLGEDGSGRSAPIEQSVYAAGVGLGHEGSLRGDAVEAAERRTRDERGDFAEQTRENARRRFEGM